MQTRKQVTTHLQRHLNDKVSDKIMNSTDKEFLQRTQNCVLISVTVLDSLQQTAIASEHNHAHGH